MAKARSKTAAAAPGPWWLLEGDEECPGCGHFYIYELEFRCPDCDTTSCIHCRRRHADGRWICESCAQSASREGR